MSIFSRRNGSKNGAGAGDVDVDEMDDVDDVEDLDEDELTDEELEELEEDLEEAFDDPSVTAEDLTPGLSAEELDDVDAAARNLLAGRKPRRQRERHGPITRLYHGETRFDFVGRRWLWFAISGIVIIAGIGSIIARGGLNLGIQFKGGVEWTVPAPGVSQTAAVNAMTAAGLPNPLVEILGHGSSQNLDVQADLNKLSAKAQQTEEQKVAEALARLTHHTTSFVNDNRQTVGPTWGSSVTDKAIEALIVFFIVVGIYISIRFEPKMALAAFIAMLHDILVATGIYSLFNFQVSPDTVVAILTIMGYSLYDTVVVFDRVRDNTKGIGSSGRMNYNQLINLSMNQTLARSINTSLVAILPVLSVLLIGAQLLGATTLKDYGLALFVGLLSGAYSSIFIASPILAMLKRGESRWISIENRLIQKGGLSKSLSALDAATMSTQLAISAGGARGGGGGGTQAPAKRSGLIRPGSASTAVMDRPGQSGPSTGTGPGGAGGGAAAGNRPGPRPRKGKGKRRR